MKRTLTWLLIILIVAIAAVGITLGRDYFSKTSRDGNPVTVTIAEGSSVSQIADTLKENGLIKYPELFALRVKNSPYENQLHFGTFELNDGMCMWDIIKALAADGAKEDTFTLVVPEGYSAEQIAQKLEDNNICSKEDFLKALNPKDYDYSFLKEIPKDDDIIYPLQGFLFPNTYEFFTNATPHDIVDTMLKEFQRQYDKLEQTDSDYSLYQLVTVASLIERESKLDKERPMISGVIYNRLDENMPLQIDATVVYAISDGMYDVDKVYYKDLEKKSPYNTYRNTGLPVGPICNPGFTSLQAALTPTSHDYLYYHTDETKQDGSHIFTKTLDEHNSTMTD